MTGAADCFRRLDAEELLPEAWRPLRQAGPVYAFNAGLVEDGPGWLLAFRIVGADTRRRIGLIRLDPDFAPRADTAVPISDWIRFGPQAVGGQATEWFADPRLYRIDGRIWLEWNSGWHDDNRQYLQEIGGDLRPVGAPREMRWREGRRRMEKNWLLFADGRELRILYSPWPHRILSTPWPASGDLEGDELVTQRWAAGAFASEYGELRGGAPPVRVDDHYHVFCHSVAGRPGDYRYVASCYRFQVKHPYAVDAVPVRPILLPNPTGAKRWLPKLNPAVGEVIYPCGAAWRDNRWVVSYGINDEAIGLAGLEASQVEATLRPSPADAQIQET